MTGVNWTWCAAAVGLLAGGANAQAAAEAQHLTAGALAERVAKTTDGTAIVNLPTAPGASMLLARRERTGEAEIHERFADQFIVQAGRATVVVGGALAGQRQTAPGEWRGGTITGGQRFEVGPGDTLWIPPGLPHQVQLPASGGDFRYFVAKFPKP